MAIFNGTYLSDNFQGTDWFDIMSLGAGNDTAHGNGDDDLLYGGSGNDLLFGDSGDDLLQGNSGNDTLKGGAGDDEIFVNEGNDYLYGNEGNDTLTMFNPNESTSLSCVLDGGSGNDEFEFFDDGVKDYLTINNFSVGQDTIWTWNTQRVSINGVGAPSSLSTMIHYPSSGNLFYDQDGLNQGSLPVHLAVIHTVGNVPLTLASFS